MNIPSLTPVQFISSLSSHNINGCFILGEATHYNNNNGTDDDVINERGECG